MRRGNLGVGMVGRPTGHHVTCSHLNNVSRPKLGPGTAKNPLWHATGPGAPSSNLQISHQRINQSGWESDPQGFQGLSHLSRKSATGATGMLSHQKLSGRCPKRPSLRPIAPQGCLTVVTPPRVGSGCPEISRCPRCPIQRPEGFRAMTRCIPLGPDASPNTRLAVPRCPEAPSRSPEAPEMARG